MTDRQPEGKESFVLLGMVMRAHGLRGEVKVWPLTESPANFTRYQNLYLSSAEGGEKVACEALQARVSGQTVVLRLSGCSTREAAEQLAGSKVWLPTSNLPPLGPDEFYLHALEGRRAETVDGQYLGRVVAILSSGGQDILVVRNKGAELLVPAVRTFVRVVEDDRVVLELPPGLLELNP
ncbi:MAG: ribosome maturation factor RimM [Desulfobulbus sp.]|nr:ribosome maturation factor RimM [Desulfobulbus sp.]